MLKRTPLLIALLAALESMLPQVEAHDIWITTIEEGIGSSKAIVNHGHPGDHKMPDPDKLFEFDLIWSSHSRLSLLPGVKSASQGGMPVLLVERLPIAPDADVLLAARYDNGYWVKTPYGYRNTSKRQVPGAEESFLSLKYAKALVQRTKSGSDFYGTVVGHRLELVPLRDPFRIKSGEAFPVRVQFDGEPLGGVWVELGDGVSPINEEEIMRYQTDREGRALVRIQKPGPQVLVVDHRVPSFHPELATIEFHSASLSFVVSGPD